MSAKARLNNSKQRLKDALSHLEKAVEVRVKTAEESSAMPLDQQKIEQELHHLREENQNLQALIGKERDKRRDSQKLNHHVGEQIDLLIDDVKVLIDQKEAS